MGKKMKSRRTRGWTGSAWFSGTAAVVQTVANVYCSLAANSISEAMKPYATCVWIGVGGCTLFCALSTYEAGRSAAADNSAPVDDHSINAEGNIAGSAVSTSGDSALASGSGTVIQGGLHIHQAPQPNSPANCIDQLRSPVGDFTGRKAELDELLTKVKTGGVAISGLRGAGGIGKTELALKLAQHLASGYPDGRIYLDLRGVTQPLTPAQAMAHVIRAWNPTATLPDDENLLQGLFQSTLHGKRVLLLWDNAKDADQVKPLLPPEGCLAIITSRNHFAIPDCHTLDLDKMPPKDACALLLKIAERVGDQASALAELCGYLPLALRNAAGAIQARADISVVTYMERLRDAKKRLELVEASLSLSYDLLDKDQQQCWRTLSVFAGSFDAPAAATVWEVELDEAEDLLGVFFVRSMVESETEGRYALHDLSKVYADSKMSDAERDTSPLRHAAHYALLARAANAKYEQGGESVLAGLALFDLERENIEAGRHWASGNETDDDRAADLCTDYALGCPYILSLRLHPRDQVDWLKSALRSARGLKDRRLEAAALGNLGSAYYLLGEYGQAVELHEQSLVIERELQNRRGEGQSLGSLGIAYGMLGEYRRANEFQRQSMAIAREIGDRRGEGLSLGNLGTSYHILGEHRQAIEFYNQQLVITREIGDQSGEGTALWNMSLALDNIGERQRAIANAEAALDIFELIEEPDTGMVREALAEWRGEA